MNNKENQFKYNTRFQVLQRRIANETLGSYNKINSKEYYNNNQYFKTPTVLKDNSWLNNSFTFFNKEFNCISNKAIKSDIKTKSYNINIMDLKQEKPRTKVMKEQPTQQLFTDLRTLEKNKNVDQSVQKFNKSVEKNIESNFRNKDTVEVSTKPITEILQAMQPENKPTPATITVHEQKNNEQKNNEQTNNKQKNNEQINLRVADQVIENHDIPLVPVCQQDAINSGESIKFPKLCFSDVNTSFSVISKMPENSKLKIVNKTHLAVEESVLQSFSRYTSGQNRETIILFLGHLFEESSKIINNILENIKNGDEKDKNINNLTTIMHKYHVFVESFEKISLSYSSDSSVIARLKTLKDGYQNFLHYFYRKVSSDKR